MDSVWKKLDSWSDAQRNWLACAVIVLAALAAYHNSFSGPFIFDDENAVVKNRTIRSLWPIWPVITPIEGGGTVCGRGSERVVVS